MSKVSVIIIFLLSLAFALSSAGKAREKYARIMREDADRKGSYTTDRSG